MSTQRLELTWIGKNHPDYDIANIEPRILIEDPEKSYGDPSSENMLIHGDNLLALKALLPEYEGKVKCIYIDPPYNTGNAFEHYDDSVEHSTWLSLMKPRMEMLYKLLTDDGFIVVHLDDEEMAYLKVMMDEVFGRKNFINSVTVRDSHPSGLKLSSRDKTIIKTKSFMLVYRKNGGKIKPIYQVRQTWDTHFNTFIEIDRKPFIKESLKERLISELIIDPEKKIDENILSDKKFYKFVFDNRDKIFQSTKEIPDHAKNLSLANPDTVVEYGDAGGNTRQFAFNGRRLSPLSKSIQNIGLGDKQEEAFSKLLCDFWDDVDFNNSQNEGDVKFAASKKPEFLVARIIAMFSSKGDIVLDSFLGSGTTAAVAQKMGRRWIGIEMGDHAYSHCKFRLDKVVDGEDQSGISEDMEWKGGGGYKFYELAPSFITIDEFGNKVIDDYYNDSKLVRAMCKLLNYNFKPSQKEYYKQGVGTGHNYLYVTTQTLSHGLVQQIATHLGTSESLVICAKKYEAGVESVDARISIKKIPQSILKACHYGKKEYLLPIRESAMEEVEYEEESE